MAVLRVGQAGAVSLILLTDEQQGLALGARGGLIEAIEANPRGTRYRFLLHPMDWPQFFGAQVPTRLLGVPVRWDEAIERGTCRLEWKHPR